MEKILVKINKDIIQFLPDYLKNRETDIVNITLALKNNDFEKVKQITHKIRGSAGLYGLMELSNIAKEMEEKSLEKNTAFLNSLLQKIIFYLANLEIVES